MQAIFTNLVVAVLVLTVGNIFVSAAPVPQNIGDALAIDDSNNNNNNLIDIKYNPASVSWSSVSWANALNNQKLPVPASSTQPTAAAPAPATSTAEAAPTYTTAPAPEPTTTQAPAPAPSSSQAPAQTSQAPAQTPSSGGSSTGGRPLWGLTYSPYNTDGSCPDAGAVASQLKQVASVASNVRLYSTDCSQLSNALQAITSNNLGLDVYAGIWVSDGAGRFKSDLDQFVAAAKQFGGSNLIKGVSVGNEETSKGVSESTLIGYISQVRSRLQAEGLGSIPVYTTEQDAHFTAGMAAVSDVVQVNIYAMFDSYFAGIDFSVQSVIQRANNIKEHVANGKPVRFGESGWSSAGTSGPCPLSLANQQAYAKKFKCAAAAAGYDYFYFEAKNANWKKGASESEQNFGIFNAGFTPKFDLSSLDSC
ncbi:glycoside hydrolase [Martensiomyces pterosporus]|nr:glycoside hydrolase [Martensiomyces pterosporus]